MTSTAARPSPRPSVAPPAIRYPIEPTPEAAPPLPRLDESDAAVGEALAELVGAKAIPAYFYPERVIRRFVVIIDNLQRRRVSARLMPVQPVPGAFKVAGTEDRLAIAPANAARYGVYLGLMERVDVPRLVDFYVRFYPLFQQAYRELGYPNGYFNDRLVATLDDLLAAPESAAPLGLVQPHVLYEYADPELEARSAGQKIMMRMGTHNAVRVKAVLRAIRSEVISRVPRG